MDLEKITIVAKRYNLALLVLFGSRARGDQRQNSDFDLAYLANQSLPLEREAELATDLAEICRGRIDLADIGRASPLLRFQIFRHGRALYEKEAGLFVERFLQAARIYEETLPLYKLKLARL